jgi:hypothetical protein
MIMVAIVLLGVLGWYIVVKVEGVEPEISFTPVSDSLGESQTLQVSVSDEGSGLRSLRVVLEKNKKEIPLLEKTFPSAGFGRGGEVKNETIPIPIEPKKLGFTDGQITLRVTLRDYSWRRWFHGNKKVLEKTLEIDTKPPEIEVLTSRNYVNMGGTGLVIFKVSEPCEKTGVRVGEDFYPGYSGYFKDPNIYLGFFALAYNQGPETTVMLQASDHAGNTSKAGFSLGIRKKIFKKDTITISDDFLNRKMPEFDLGPGSENLSPVEKFIKVNRDIRKASYEKVSALANQTENVLYWEDIFLRFPNSSPMAGFAETRDYLYNGQKIDQQTHMGIDLASTIHAPVPAGNRGKVAFAETLGIYGRTVVLDHGFGLMSMYSHLSRIDVKPGDKLEKGDILGATGTTGMAGGDHLHYAMMVYTTYVNPTEWWDPHWIRDNITAKIKSVQGAPD